MNKRFQQVAVLKGGPSSEREVSLRSGAAIAAGLRSLGYEVAEVDVSEPRLALPAGIQAVFIALHGTFGEDGTVQAQLEQLGLPYTGPGVRASRDAFDKVATKRILDQHGIPSPAFQIVHPRDTARLLPLPVVVKPPREGSSVGVSRVRTDEEWRPALDRVFALGQEALVEAFIDGRELTVGVVGDQVLPVVEIRAPDGAYDYRAKYTAGLTEYLVPAPIDAETTQTCQALGWRVFQALGCRGMGRVDIRLSPEGRPYVLEINTIPGFTETSLLPKAARCAGLPFPQLCEKILNLAACDGPM